MKNTLELRQLSFGYDDMKLLEPTDLALTSGTLVGLCGLNGTGKSSLFRMLAGLERKYSGDILVDGRALQSLTIAQRASEVAYLNTERPRLEGIDVHTLFEMAAFDRVPPHELETHIKHCMTLTATTAFARHALSRLSDGELQKVMFGRALAQNTPILIADEPTAFLDYKAKRELTQLMYDLAHQENKLVLFSSHDLELVKEFADIRLVLANRKLNRIKEGDMI